MWRGVCAWTTAALFSLSSLLMLCAPLALPGVARAQTPAPTAFALELLSPTAAQPSTTREFVHVLGRSTPGATVRVGGEPVTVYATGVFARDRVPLALGTNTIRIEAVLPDGTRLSRDLVLERLPAPTTLPPAPPLPTSGDEAPRIEPPRLFVVGADGAELVHGLHGVRLGGPYLAELPAGTLLSANGRLGDFLRVQLSADTIAWVLATAVSQAPPGTVAPWVAPTSLAVAGSADGDVVSIPLPAAVPYAVRAVTSADGRHQLEVDLYGAHNAATWISHRASARVVREVTVETPASGRLRVRIAPVAARLWGWRVERTATALRIVVRPAPVIADAGTPLKGLRVALEAGHGSAANTGAVGATGVFEKDINRLTALALQAELEAAGATVVQVREGDDNPPQRERAARVTASDAQLFISLHGNAADVAGGFLRVQGTSSYHKHDTGRDLAQAVHRRVLAQTGLADFGRVGNFNYTPIRLVTWMPAMLFEQAFVTHPGDEAQLLDAAFRVRMAQAVRLGIEDFLRTP